MSIIQSGITYLGIVTPMRILASIIKEAIPKPLPPLPNNERYFTQLDGQSKYWRRLEPDYGQTTTATIECLFFGKSGSGFEYLIGRNSNDRFYIGLNSSGDVGYAKGGSNFAGQTTVDLTKINHAKLVADGTDVKFYVNGVLISTQAQGWTGLLDEVGFGVKGDQLLDFYSGILVSARVTTDTVDNVYGLDTNLPYDLPDVNYQLRDSYEFDGVDDYISIPTIGLVAGDVIKLKLVKSVSPSDYIFRDAILNLIFIREWTDGTIYFGGGSLTIDGVPAVSLTTPFPNDGLEHELEFTVNRTSQLSVLGARGDTFAGSINYPIYDVEVTAASGNRFYAMDGNSQTLVDSLDTSTPRFRYEFGPSANATIPPLALEAGDVVSFKFIMNDLNDIANKFFMASADGQLNVSVRTDGFWNLFGNSGNTATIDGNLLVQGGTHMGQYADGREHIIQITIGAPVADVVTIGSASTGGQDFDGIMYDVEFTSAAGNHFYAIDDNSQTIVDSVSGQDGTIQNYDAASWEFGTLTDGTIENYDASNWLSSNYELGANDWGNNPSSIDASITDNGDGTYTCDGSQLSNASLRVDDVLTLGSNYYSGLEIVGYTEVGGGVNKRVRMSVGSTFINATANGKYSGVTQTNSDDNIYITIEVGVACTVRGVFARTAPDSALMFENGSVDGSDRLLVTENEDGSGFDGEEIWADRVKAISGNAAAPTPNSITINETGSALAAVGIGVPPAPITVSGVATITSGQVDVSVIPGFSGVAASITVSGPFSFDLDSQGAVNFKRAFNSGAVAEITDLEVTVRYDYANGAAPAEGFPFTLPMTLT